MGTFLASAIAIALMAGFVWLIAALWIGSGRLARKGLDAMDGAASLKQRPLPPPPPGSRRY